MVGGAEQLRGLALGLGSQSDLIPHAETFPRQPMLTPHHIQNHGRGSAGDQGAKKPR